MKRKALEILYILKGFFIPICEQYADKLLRKLESATARRRPCGVTINRRLIAK